MHPYFDPRRDGRWRDCWADLVRSIVHGTADMSPLRRTLCHWRTDRLLDAATVISITATLTFFAAQFLRLAAS